MPSKHQFIESLSAELKPIKRLAPPSVRTLNWALLTFAVVVGGLSLIGPYRPGWIGQLGFNQFTIETLAAFSSLFVGSLIVFKLNVPGLQVSRVEKTIGFLPIFIFISLLLFGLSGHPSLQPSMLGKRPTCVFEVLVMSVPPLVFLLFQLSKGCSRLNATQFFLIGVAASSVPIGLMQVVCMYDPAHILKFHLGPGLVVTGLTVVFGVLWVRRPLK